MPSQAVQPEPERARPASGKRLAWLDALRGIAALCVVLDHLTYSVLQSARTTVYHWFDPGQYGVFAFCLVSGYTVPAARGPQVARWLDDRYGEDVPPRQPEAAILVPAEVSTPT